jgi:hypothetical protein
MTEQNNKSNRRRRRRRSITFDCKIDPIQVEVFWIVTPCNFSEYSTLKMEAASSSETLVSYRNTTHGFIIQKTRTCILPAVKTSNLASG